MKKYISKYENILLLIISTIATLGTGLKYLVDTNSYEFTNPNSFVWFIVLFYNFVVIKKVLENKEKRLYIISGITSGIIAIFAITGYFAAEYSNAQIEHYTSKFVFYLFTKFIIYVFYFFNIITISFNKLEKNVSKYNIKETCYKYFTNNKKSFVIVAIIIFIAYIPHFLNYFPGNGMPDSVTEVLQAIGVKPLSNHHPVMHILLIRLFMTIGNVIFKSYVAGYALAILAQIIAVALVFSYCIYFMAELKITLKYRIITLIFFMFSPILTLYNTTLLKDVPFALSTLLFIIFIIKMLKDQTMLRSLKNKILLILILLGVMFFRNNGLYVVVLTLPFLIIAMKKQYKQILITFLIPIIWYMIITGPVYNYFNVIKGSTREALSIPLQQFARISKYKSDKLTQDEKDRIYKYLPADNIGDLYHPLSSDPVKDKFSDENFKEDKIGLIKLYFKLALKFPGQTVYSFINNSYGYYYPDTVGWGVTYGINELEFKYSNNGENYGLERKPIVNIPIIDKVNDFINVRNIPLISMIASPGFYFWLMCLVMAFCIYTKKYKELIIYVPILSLWLTCLASPVFCENRYIYSLFMTLPILMIVPFIKSENKGE